MKRINICITDKRSCFEGYVFVCKTVKMYNFMMDYINSRQYSYVIVKEKYDADILKSILDKNTI